VTWRLAIGWAFGLLVSVMGLSASYLWDLPTGATVVTTFGTLLAAVALGLGVRVLIQEVRRRGLSALTGVGIAGSTLVAILGLLLIIFPQMDHLWLNWLEEAVPSIELAFLTPRERQTYRDSREAIRRGLAELQRLRAIQQEVQWGTRQMPADQQERLRQFLAGRSEITAGDRLVLRTLRSKARERQRYWLGIPLLAVGGAGALALARARRRRTA
jgi:zinc/manganese transport system permease protein